RKSRSPVRSVVRTPQSRNSTKEASDSVQDAEQRISILPKRPPPRWQLPKPQRHLRRSRSTTKFFLRNCIITTLGWGVDGRSARWRPSKIQPSLNALKQCKTPFVSPLNRRGSLYR